jgi:hypothetical protein
MNIYNVNLIVNQEHKNFNLKAENYASAINYLNQQFKEAELISFNLILKNESKIITLSKI